LDSSKSTIEPSRFLIFTILFSINKQKEKDYHILTD